MKTGKGIDAVLGAAVVGLALVIVGSGCVGDESATDSHDVNTSITNSVDASIGIDLPDGASEVAPGLYAWIDGNGNRILYDVTTSSATTNPIGVVFLGVEGDNNDIQVYFRPVVEQEEEPTPEE
jgi:hypothetical protein